MAGLIIGGFAVLPDVTIAALTTLVALPFLCVTALRLVALRQAFGLPRQRIYVAGPRARRVPDRMLPLYSVLVPLYREGNVLPALVHPVTADLWVVLEGGGTLTTGGVLEKGRINGGQSRQISAGDVVYIPSGLPHGVSGVEKNITWLNVRWDTDWPPDSPMGAGTLNSGVREYVQRTSREAMGAPKR